MGVTRVITIHPKTPSNNCWNVSFTTTNANVMVALQEKSRDRQSRLDFILWGPWMSVSTEFHGNASNSCRDTYQTWLTNVVIPRAMPPLAWLKTSNNIGNVAAEGQTAGSVSASEMLPVDIAAARTTSCNLCSELVSCTVWLCCLNIKLFGTFPATEPEVRLLCNTDARPWGRHFLKLAQRALIFHMTTVSCMMARNCWNNLLATQQIIALICLYCDIWSCNLWLYWTVLFYSCYFAHPLRVASSNMDFSVFFRQFQVYIHTYCRVPNLKINKLPNLQGPWNH